MCSNFASQAEARGAVWKNCVAVLLNSIRFFTLFGIAKLLYISTSDVAIPEYCIANCDATPLILRFDFEDYEIRQLHETLWSYATLYPR
jgi:hypothetical protein